MSNFGAALGILIFLLAITALVVLPILFFKLRRLRKSLSSKEISLQSLESEVGALRKYNKVLDADMEADRIITQAKAEAQELKNKAANEINTITTNAKISSEHLLQEAAKAKEQAEQQAKETLKEARDKASGMREKAERTLNESIEQSERLIEDAKKRANEIAGEALEAKGKAEQYEKAAIAMKNLLDGYGDEYVIPSRSVLDDLAEDYGYKEAGQELKRAREHTITMVKNDLAADCDYVEKNRRMYAIHFVLDAFNGKVDTILSKVRHNNYGKMKQEILDAFNLVNHNGAAFRNARIRQLYLDARLDELKWAVAVYQLQLQEREEQRRIQEAMREEEKARREYEKAIREAEKEEKMLQAAMEKARQELAAATAEQRQELEQQIETLQQKLTEAESKEQRALSMAQQTKRGHVYVISNLGSFGDDVFKVGLTRRLEPEIRIRELGDASVPFPFDIHAMIFSEDAPLLETELHRKFQDRQVNLVNPKKEFFRFGVREIKDVVDEMGIEAHWTLVAEAQEYRESLALKKKAATPQPSAQQGNVPLAP